MQLLIFKLVDKVKQIALPKVGRPEYNKRDALSQEKREFFLLNSLRIGTSTLFLVFGLKQKQRIFLGLKLASLWARTASLPFLVLRTADLDWTKPSALPGLQFADSSCRSWYLATYISALASSFTYCLYTYPSLYILLVLFLGRTLTNTLWFREGL